MASTLAKVARVETLEEKVPPKPCKKHPGPLVFIQRDGDVDKKLAEIGRCRACKGRKRLVIKLERFDWDAYGQMHEQYRIEHPEWWGAVPSTISPDVPPPVLTIGDGDNSDDDW